MLILRFDMRAPSDSNATAELYSACIDMCAWAETRGANSVVFSEHHATDDNHLPSPLIMAAAVAARTQQIAIVLAAVVLPFCDPVRLAEEMSVLDIISKGRTAYVLGVGHRAEEYDHFQVDFHQRGRLADEKLALLLQLLKTEWVTDNGRHSHVTPRPFSAGGPRIMIGGASPAAVKRAASHGLGFMAQANPPGLKEMYLAECRAHGHAPGPAIFSNSNSATAVFVADNVEAAWNELGPYLLHDATVAASYRHGDDSVTSISRAQTIAGLRDPPGPYRIYSMDDAVERLRKGESLQLLPLCGGLPPELAWRYLKFAADAVARARS